MDASKSIAPRDSAGDASVVQTVIEVRADGQCVRVGAVDWLGTVACKPGFRENPGFKENLGLKENPGIRENLGLKENDDGQRHRGGVLYGPIEKRECGQEQIEKSECGQEQIKDEREYDEREFGQTNDEREDEANDDVVIFQEPEEIEQEYDSKGRPKLRIITNLKGFYSP